MANRLSNHWGSPSESPQERKGNQRNKSSIVERLLLDEHFKKLESLEVEVRTILWTAAQERKDSDEELGEILGSMESLQREMEVTAAAREEESLEESIRNDPHHASERTKLAVSVGSLPEIRRIVEPLLELRSKTRQKIRLIRKSAQKPTLN